MNVTDIAEKAKVSTATVSRVLNNSSKVGEKTRQRVLDVINSKNFKPTRSKTENNVIGITVVGIAPGRLDYVYDRELITGIMETASRMDAGVKVLDMNDLMLLKPKRGIYRDYLKQIGVSSLVHFGFPDKYTDLIDAIAQDGIDQVVLERQMPNENIHWIDIDNYGASYNLGQYLLNQGCYKSAVITASREYSAHSDRCRGFIDAFKDSKKTIPDNWNIERDLVSTEAGMSATLSLLTQNAQTPDCIYYTNMELALGGVKALINKGIKVAEDITVAIFDDANFSQLIAIPVLSLHQPSFKVGSMAVEFLLSVDKENRSTKLIVPEMFIPTEISAILENKQNTIAK